MFDANACGLPIGRRFFVEIYAPHPDLPQYKVGDVALCYMMAKENRWDPIVCVLTGDDHVVLNHQENYCDYWFVYAGNATGTGYIRENVKDQALKLLGGEWDKQ